MILNKDNREKAAKEFDRLSSQIQNQLLGTTVRLAKGDGVASGVIVGRQAPNETFILTAKHNLYTLSGQKLGNKKPVDFDTQSLRAGITIGYSNTTLLQKPNASAPGIDRFEYWGSDNQSWKYDAIVAVSVNPGLYAHAGQWIPLTRKHEHKLLAPVGSSALPGLVTSETTLVQLGYGRSSDAQVPATTHYPVHYQSLQFKTSTAQNAELIQDGFTIERNEKKGTVEISDYEEAILLHADPTWSTGPGDSGGPLFGIAKSVKGVPHGAYVLGVTTGAEMFQDPALRTKPEKARKDHLFNNIATSWKRIIDSVPLA